LYFGFWVFLPRLRRSSYQKSAPQCWHENVDAPRFNGSNTILIKRIKFGGKGFKGKERKIGALKVGMGITLSQSRRKSVCSRKFAPEVEPK
jgi:hypothetical protein